MRNFIIILAMAALAGCEQDVTVDGRQAFLENCAGCHGDDAHGAGPLGRDLAKVPPDLTVLTRKYGGTFPRDYVMSTIDGFQRNSHFSADMPEFGAGDMGPTVIVETDGLGTPVPVQLLALTNYLQGIQR